VNGFHRPLCFSLPRLIVPVMLVMLGTTLRAQRTDPDFNPPTTLSVVGFTPNEQLQGAQRYP